MHHQEIFFVPINFTRLDGVVVVRTAQLPDRTRTALAFTSCSSLISAMGRQQAWTTMSEAALRTSMRCLDITRIHVDAEFVGAAVTRLPSVARSAGVVSASTLVAVA